MVEVDDMSILKQWFTLSILSDVAVPNKVKVELVDVALLDLVVL